MTMQKDDRSKDNNGQKWIDVPSFINSSNDSNNVTNQPRNSSADMDDTGEFMREVKSSLAKQVSSDLEENIPKRSNKKRKHKRLSRIIKAFVFTLLTLTAICCLLLFTGPGRSLVIRIASEYIYSNLEYEGSEDSVAASGDDITGPEGVEATDKIVNILLIGIEEIGSAQNTDSMIIATMNTEDHSLKLTSLMRDTYVQIPGHDNNRLNSAYAKGGIELLYDTIELNFGVRIDGYCMVNFEAFQEIVDLVGGVKITLTDKEADYLNSTNYISDPANRNVIEGIQTMNGNQALGYCRIRKRPTATESNDFGRTQRQRIVLTAIFDKVKSKNVIELAMLMNDILTDIPIKTDITKNEFNRYLEEAANLKVKRLETLRLPTDDNVENANIDGKDVLNIPDWDAARDEIYTFIYGDVLDTGTTK